MKAKIGPNNEITSHTYLEKKGRVYGNYIWVNDVRMRFLEGVPEEKVTQLSLSNNYDRDLYDKFLEGSEKVTKEVYFCVVQKSPEDVPVFILPATQDLTVNMNNEQRASFMKEVFEKCHQKYCEDCGKKNITPVDKKYCAATVVAGTKTMWGGNHFTAMIKPPGNNQWLHVDPTDFGGPQKFNRKQCGGYSSMIEAEALIHYSSKTIAEAMEDEQQNIVIRSFWQFIDTLAFKFNTWFAGARNEVIRNDENQEVPRGKFETTYAEMADFSAGRLAQKFNNQEFIDARIHGNLITSEPKAEHEKKTSEDNNGSKEDLGSDWTYT
ncbi:hypothetical protein [Legionella tucsonensis]|uniref:Uncharacterized protein n=1 Tax=Legionella tucsonensis TaxID=40335 RepID=A0A0W0ZQN4_9GAMM|nr:hypothetical protein [Legionella tucsonensis]KTD71532.1 hypothetical protein Ltuc_2514 [Legionella tucsonensis]